jgi:hypothetical protein
MDGSLLGSNGRHDGAWFITGRQRHVNGGAL